MGGFAGGRYHCTLIKAALQARIAVKELDNRVSILMFIFASFVWQVKERVDDKTEQLAPAMQERLGGGYV